MTYFSKKMRISMAPGFSIDPSIRWYSNRYAPRKEGVMDGVMETNFNIMLQYLDTHSTRHSLSQT